MIKIKVSKKYNNKKIVNFLLDSFPSIPSSAVYKALRKKDILVNGKRIKENTVVFENDEIIAYIALPSIEIVYEDDNIIVVNKPSGISVTEDSTSSQTLTNLVQEKYPKAMPAHRLDRNTSGLVLYAKNEESLNILLDKFKTRQIDKYYVCVVYGILKEKKKTLSSYLFKDTKKSMVYISDEPKKGYQNIVTSYEVLDENKEKNISLLEIKLETGRTHQIRAHLAHIGHPIIGDRKYGINSVNKEFNKKSQILISYKLKFAFTSDADLLNYLKDKEIKIDFENKCQF